MYQFPENMKRVFKDPQKQREFEKNGFVVLPFYNAEEVRHLENLYDELHPADEKGFYPSTFSKDKRYRQKTDEQLRQVGARSVREHLQDVTVVCGSFIVKYPGPESKMGVHQDMTLVDESEFTGINIWCPLVDLDDQNGVLYVLPGSHRIVPTYRGATIPNIYDEIHESLPSIMTPLYLKAGEAVFFDQSIIHFSPPNLSGQRRIVTNIYFSHKDVRYMTAYYPKTKYPDKIELFAQEESFMTDFDQFGDNIFDRPKIGKSLGCVDYNFPKLAMDELLPNRPGEIKKTGNGFLQRLKRVFQ